jgi:kanamycin kinase
MYLKLVDQDWEEASIEDEVARLAWLHGRVPVPRVLESGAAHGCDWMLTAALPGSNAIDPSWTSEPERLALALGAGLRRLHEVAIDGCPFDANTRALEEARKRMDPLSFTAPEALEPVEQDLVVTHGDACLPNFLLEDWSVTGYVDLGAMGVADRWRDIAVCLWSLERNLGSGWDRAFLQGYGVERDEARVEFYQKLYHAL